MPVCKETPLIKKKSPYSGETCYEYRGYTIYQNKSVSSGYWGRWRAVAGFMKELKAHTREECVQLIDQHIVRSEEAKHIRQAKMAKLQEILAEVYGDSGEPMPKVIETAFGVSVNLIDTPTMSLNLSWYHTLAQKTEEETVSVKMKQPEKAFSVDGHWLAELAQRLTKASQVVSMINGLEPIVLKEELS